MDRSRSRRFKCDNPYRGTTGTSHQAGAWGQLTATGNVGLRGSTWSPPPVQPNQVPFRQSRKSDLDFVPPHLRQPAPENQVEMANSTIAPHLRVLKEAAMANTNIDTQRQMRSSSHDAWPAANPNSKFQEATPLHPVQPMSGGWISKEEAFLSIMNKKASQDMEAKKAAIEKRRLETVQPEPVQPSAVKPSQPWPEVCPEEQPSVLVPSRPRLIPDFITDQAFQTFLSTQINNPATKGKTYNFTGGQQAPQAPPNGGANLLATNTNLELRGNASGKADLHSAFNPRDLVFKTSSPFTSNDVAPPPPNIDANVESGLVPRSVSGELDDKISNTGVEEKVKENVRATQGQDPKEEFLDWDGKSWRPAPIDWETDRPGFDNGFIPTYIRQDWEPNVPRGPYVAIDTKDPNYQLGMSIGKQGFEAPIDHPMTFPDVANSENEKKRCYQTADADSLRAQKRADMQEKANQRWTEAHVVHNLQLETREPEEHPYAPKIEMYLRPATETDVKGILHIYNHYVSSSMATEDQAGVTEDDIRGLILRTKREKLPIIVAVKGKMPLPSDTKPSNRSGWKGKMPLPQFEKVIGFAYVDTYNYGINGARTGRSRFTANLQFYVHPDFTRKRVGQSLLDRLIQCLSYGYGAKDGYDWLNPTEDPIYNTGGVGKWHQMLIQYAVRSKDDPNYEMMTNYLRRFYFFEGGRIGGIAKSGPSSDRNYFGDVVFFLKQASDAAEFALA